MKLRIFLVALILMNHVAWAKDIALSFDDAPTWSAYFSGQERTEKLIQALRKSGVSEAAIFVVGNHIKTKEDAQRISSYAGAGHAIANHSYSHKKPEVLDVEKYISDIKMGHVAIKNFPTFHRWYRFPFLQEGADIQTRDKIRNALNEMDYRNGYVTVDTYDWYLNDKFLNLWRAKNQIDFEKLKTIYVNHLVNCAEFYEGLAQKNLGRSVKHVLLLHENDLAALFLTDVVDTFRKNGWHIVPISEAYADPIYSSLPDTPAPVGDSLISQIARTKGVSSKQAYFQENEAYWDKVFENLHEGGSKGCTVGCVNQN